MRIMQSERLKNELSIGITTKNRRDDLDVTLRKLEKSDLRHVPIFIIDDGGDDPFIEPSDYELDIRITRHGSSKGYMTRRNELAGMCGTKYIMSLDDDSFPVSGDIAEVFDIFDNSPEVKSIALNICPPTGIPVVHESQDYETRYFIGCGHIHEVECFLSLGGYTENRIYGYEEVEYSLKLASRGYKVVHKSNYTVVHNRSQASRQSNYNAQCTINRGWVNGTYLGIVANLIELYSFIKNHGFRNLPEAVKLYLSGYAARESGKSIRFSDYFEWKLRKAPSMA